jgi:hypothetical protein
MAKEKVSNVGGVVLLVGVLLFIVSFGYYLYLQYQLRTECGQDETCRKNMKSNIPGWIALAGVLACGVGSAMWVNSARVARIQNDR